MQKHKVYYITPNDEKEPMAIIVPNQFFTNSIFQKMFKILERENCKIEELREKEVVTTVKERHPLTGEFV